MNTNTAFFAAVALTGLLSSTASAFQVTNEVAPGQVTLTWDSQVNHAYEVMRSTNLTEGPIKRATVQATPPLNTWWENIGPDVRFHAVARPLVTNSPPPSVVEFDQLLNGDFMLRIER